jgi:hypothetical protein
MDGRTESLHIYTENTLPSGQHKAGFTFNPFIGQPFQYFRTGPELYPCPMGLIRD